MAAGGMVASLLASCTSTSREWTPVKCCSINSLLTRSGASCFKARMMSVPSVICPIPATMPGDPPSQPAQPVLQAPGLKVPEAYRGDAVQPEERDRGTRHGDDQGEADPQS